MALSNLPLWLLLLLIPILLLFKQIKKFQKSNKQQLPPSPPTLPLIGNLHQLGALLHHSYRQLSRKYGPVMLLKFGRVPVVVISSAEAAREVLKVHDLECCSRPHLAGSGKLTYNYLDIAFAPYGDYWREVRKMCVSELLSMTRVQSFQFIREEEVHSVMNSIAQSSSSAIPVNLSEKMFALAGSIVIRLAFGQIFKGTNFGNHKFEKLMHAAQAMLGSFSVDEYLPYKIGWIIDKLSGYHTKLDKVFQELDIFFEQVISDHLKPEDDN